MSSESILILAGQIVAAAIGAGGIVSIYLNGRLATKEAEAKQKREYRKKKAELEAEYRSAQGRFSFWLARGCEKFNKAECKDYWNGEAQEAYENLERIENRIKMLDRAMLADKTE